MSVSSRDVNKYHSVWVSYCSADSDVVHTLTKQVQEIDWKEEEQQNTSEGDNGEKVKPFKLKTYLREKPTDTDGDYGVPVNGRPNQYKEEREQFGITFLRPGESIEMLIQTIAGGLRRAFFLSHQYVQSKYCLRELMLSLARKPSSPIFLVICTESGSLNEFMEPMDYKSLNNQSLTLPQALAEMYEELGETVSYEYKIKGDTPTDFFEKRLTNLEDKIYLTCPHSDLLGEIKRYTTSFNFCNEKDQLKEERHALFTDWLEYTDMGSYFVDKYKYDADFFLDTLAWPIANINDTKTLSKKVRKYISTNRAQLLKKTAELDFLISQVMSCAIDLDYIAEIRFNSLNGRPFRIGHRFSEDSDRMIMRNLYSFTAVAASRTQTLKLKQSKPDYLTPRDSHSIHPIALEEEPNIQHKVEVNFISRVLGKDKQFAQDLINTGDRARIRAEVQAVLDDNFQNSTVFLHGYMTQSGIDYELPTLVEQLINSVNEGSKPDTNDPPINFNVLFFGFEDEEHAIVTPENSQLFVIARSWIEELNKND